MGVSWFREFSKRTDETANLGSSEISAQTQHGLNFQISADETEEDFFFFLSEIAKFEPEK